MKHAPMVPTVNSRGKIGVCIVMTSPTSSLGRRSRAGDRASSRQGSSSPDSRSSHDSSSQGSRVCYDSSSQGSRSSHGKSFPGSRFIHGSRTSAETVWAVSTGSITGAISHTQDPGRDTVWTQGNLAEVWTRGGLVEVWTRGSLVEVWTRGSPVEAWTRDSPRGAWTRGSTTQGRKSPASSVPDVTGS